jgi:uncharacterized protein (TIGR04255 family)
MTQSEILKIDLSEEFQHLSNPPITEAVIEIRTPSSVSWNKSEIQAELKSKLTEYPEQRSAQGFVSQLQLGAGKEPSVKTQDLGWQGVQVTSGDKKCIAKFQLEFFSFSRLQPYESWDIFTSEAIRLWEIHKNLAKPIEVQRMGVRFINRFPILAQPAKITDYFTTFIDELPSMNLLLGGFLHHDIFIIPGHPYKMNVIKTVQNLESTTDSAFILDVDIFTSQPFSANTEQIEKHLKDMHWLKNKVFFNMVTSEQIGKLK